MKTKAFLAAGICVILGAAVWLMLKKDGPPPQPDPAFYHTPEGVNFTIQAQKSVLGDALARKDLAFIHGHMYYLEGLADALSEKIAGDQKKRVGRILAEFKRIAEEIDNFAGRGNFEA